MRQIQKDSVNISVEIYIIDDTDGTPETGVVFNTAGIDLNYRRDGAAVVSITEIDLTTPILTDAHEDGGFLHVSNGRYRFDIPDAAFATAVSQVTIGGTVTGMVVLPVTIQLVDFDPDDAVRMGLTAMPNAAAEAAGGLFTRGTGAGQINQSANGQIDANAERLNNVAQSLLDLKDFADAGYNPGTNKVQGVVLTDTLTTLTGHTNQTGDNFARLGVNGAGLTDLGGMSTGMKAEVNAEADTALTDYDPPTRTEATSDKDEILAAIPADLVSGTADSGTTTTMVDAARTEGDTDYWKDSWIKFTSGTISGQTRLITGFTPASDTITFSPATTQAVGTNTYEIIPAAVISAISGHTAQTGDNFARLGVAGASLTDITLNAASIDLIWDEVLTGASHNVVNSAGRRIRTLQEFQGYALGAIWIDTVNGIAGTADFENGTVNNPVLTLADAITLAASLNLKRFVVTPGSSITFAESHTNELWVGTSWTLALGGQDCSETTIKDASVSGTATAPSGDIHFEHCEMGTCTLGEAHLDECDLSATITLSAAATYNIIKCLHDGSSIVDFGAAVGNTTVHIHGYEGGLTINNMGQSGTDVLHFTSAGGQLTLASSCIGGTVHMHGTFNLVDNSSGMTLNNDGAVVTTLGALGDAAVTGDPTTGDTIMQYIKQLVNLLAGSAGIGTMPAAVAPGNGVNLFEILRSVYDDTNSLDGTKIPNTLSLANINTEVDNSMVTYGLDHLVFAAVVGADIIDDSIIAQLVSASATADWDDFVNTTESLQALRDRGDAAWTTGAGTGLTPLASGTAQGGTSSTIQLASGESFANDEMNGNIVKITSGTGTGQSRTIIAYVGSTDTATVTPNWTTTPDATSVYEIVEGSVNIAAVSNVAEDLATTTELNARTLLAASYFDPAADTVATVTTLTGHTNQTGDNFARLGANGAGLSDLGGMSTGMKAEVESEANDALVVQKLDHLVAVAESDDPVDNSIIARLAAKGATADWSTFNNTTESQEALRDRGDAAWTTGSGTGLTPLASGTAQGGTSSTIQLASGESFANDEMNGNIVKITSGTGVGQSRTIIAYVGSTDTATVTPNWTTTPDATSVYEIVEGSVNIAAVSNVAEDLATTTELNARTLLAASYFDPATDTVATVTTLTNLPSITSNWLTAAGIAASALNGKGDWNIGKTGYDLSTAGILAIWHQALTAVVTAGSIGKLLKDEITSVRMAVLTDWINGGRLDLLLDAIKAITDVLPDSGALTTIGTDTARLTAVRAAVLTDWINGGRLDLLLDAIKAVTDVLPDSGALTTLQADTDDIQTRLPTALIGGRMDSDIEAINNNTESAVDLSASARTIVRGTVDTATNSHTPTTTEFQADDITEATADHFNGRIVIFTSGVLKDQGTDITDYVSVGGIGQFTVTAMTEAPSNNDTFVIV